MQLPATSLARNVMWSALAQAWTFALSVVSLTVLARLLSPTEYAVMAVVTPLLALAMQVQGLGLGSAIVQAQTVSRSQLGTLFWIGFGIALVLTAGLVLAAPQIAVWLGDSRIEPALRISAAAVLVVSLGGQANALLVRGLRFRVGALRNVVAATLGAAVSIGIAWRTGSYWALIGGLLTVHTVNLIGNVWATRWHPARPGSLAEARPLLRFGLSVWSAQLVTFASRHSDNLIVAAAASPRELGLYDRAYQVLLSPLGQAVQPLGQVVSSTLARCREEPARYRLHYWRAIMVLLALLHPALVLALANPETFVGLLLGPQWLDAAPLFGWFAGGGLVTLFVVTLDWLLVSQGRGGELFRKELVGSLVALASFGIGIGWGIKGVAVAFVLGQVLIAAPHALWLTGRSGSVQHRELAARLAPHGAALAAVLALVLAAKLVINQLLWPQLIVLTLAAYLLYAATLAAIPASRQLIAGVIARGAAVLVRLSQRLLR